MPTISGTLADSLIDLIEGLTVSFTANGTAHTSTIKGYRWLKKEYDQLPAAVVELPAIDRTGIDEGESQIGTRDFLVRFPIDFLFDLDDAVYAQEQAIATVEAFIDAVDDAAGPWSPPPLGDSTIQDMKVVEAGDPSFETDQNRAYLVFPTVVEVLKFTSDT